MEPRDGTAVRSSSDENEDPSRRQGVCLEPDQLSPDALRGLVEEYVTREGTDYGAASGDGWSPGPGDWSLDDKVTQVLGQIERGEARIVFDLESETASIVSADALDRFVLASPAEKA